MFYVLDDLDDLDLCCNLVLRDQLYLDVDRDFFHTDLELIVLAIYDSQNIGLGLIMNYYKLLALI